MGTGMLPRLSQRTFDLMRRTIEAVDRDTADLITTLVASAFVDGRNEGVTEAKIRNQRYAPLWGFQKRMSQQSKVVVKI
jgi:hypothetical protein